MTKNKTKEPSVITYAFIANILYFFICAIYCNVNSQNRILDISFFTLSVLLWFIIGNNYSRKLKQINIKKYLSFILINFLPILFFLIAYNILINISINSQTYNWILYYSVGAPIIFWIKPASFLINVFNMDFYLFAYFIVASLMCICFLGLLSSGKKRKIKTAQKSAYVNKELPGLTAEAAVSMKDETHSENIIGNIDNILEYDDETEQATFDKLQTVESKLTAADIGPISDNIEIKTESDKNKK